MAWALPLLLVLGTPARAGEAPVTVRMTASIAPRLAAMPRIARPADTAERRVNAALDRLDRTVRKALAVCRSDQAHQAFWQRTVEVPMRGPRFLLLVVADDVDCGAQHPYASTMAVVYDLRTGRPVDWAVLLPAELAAGRVLAEGRDGTRTVRLTSSRVRDLFLRFYDHGEADAASDCKGVVTRATAEGFAASAWLDGKDGNLVLQTDLAPFVQSCADPVFVPVATLRELGARTELVDALTHAAADAAYPPSKNDPSTIGTATMLPDGTILLQLRAEVPGAVLGDAQLRYPPGNPHYRTVRDHLPALRPGGTVSVPPFP